MSQIDGKNSYSLMDSPRQTEIKWFVYQATIRIGGRLAAPPLRYHRAYVSVPRLFNKVKCLRADPGIRSEPNVGLAHPGLLQANQLSPQLPGWRFVSERECFRIAQESLILLTSTYCSGLQRASHTPPMPSADSCTALCGKLPLK
jgi:hypothetical protein